MCRSTATTANLADRHGIAVSAGQAEALDGLLASAPGARSALERFPSSDRPVIEDVVREAFVNALGGAYRVGAFVALAGLVLAALLIRRRPPADDREAGSGERVEAARDREQE